MGTKEPDTLIGEDVGIKRPQGAGVHIEIVEGMKDRIMEIALAGHDN